ncbi:DUF262 domain-containing protein [Nocardia colli]|uniref:DUF262 domain-containing protein n=1 Tax=Nocardia colli TaxID=2545717 RepID=A0A5N0E9F6_9NOCA|nr:DUF262 domain-containing protein [Nocardia colli]KAA8885089.1 DUF262 domain-containing protein [Nocardia colli]
MESIHDEGERDENDAESDERQGILLPPRNERASWLDDASQEQEDVSVVEYDIVSSPNDWNFTTIVNFIESGALKIPAFQRNFVWDQKRASKLIESLMIGLPVPQVFLYEEGRNNFIVIDGQQRLLTLFFFAKGRFPLPKIRGELRPGLSSGVINDEFLHDDIYFTDFKLTLPKTASGVTARYHGLSYKTLKEDRIVLDLRTIRNIVVKQMSPAGDSAIYEIFSRLNTGGVNLSPQEIRASLYHSYLINAILALNLEPEWRALVGESSPDPRMRDTEFLLRSLALARKLDSFRGSMAAFVNSFCEEVKQFSLEQADGAVSDLRAFFDLFQGQSKETFSRSGKFSGVLFESFFAAWIRKGRPQIDPSRISASVIRVKNGARFAATLQEGSTKPVNIKNRIGIAEEELEGLK